MKCRAAGIGLLALLILIVAAPTALAQDITGDRLIIGQSFTLKSEETLAGNLAVLGGSVELQQGSAVRGDIAVFGGNLGVDGTVTGDVVLFGGSATLHESAVINGDLAVFGGAIHRAPGAVVTGEVIGGLSAPFTWLPRIGGNFAPPEFLRPRVGQSNDIWDVLGAIVVWQLVTLAWVVGLALLGAIAVSAAPQAMGRIADQAASAPFMSFSMGLLTLVVGFLLGLLFLIACCSGLLVWLALLVAGVVGWLAVGLWLGQRLLQALRVHNANALGEIALGVAIITVLARLPWCIGSLFGLALGCVGLGAVVLTRFGTQPPEGISRRPAIPPERDDQPTVRPERGDAMTLPPVSTTGASTAGPEAPATDLDASSS